MEALARKKSSIVGVDLALAAVKMTKMKSREANLEDAEVIRADGLELCFANDAFEIVICADVVEHVDNELSFLDELRRVLMPGGSLLITAPANMMLWSQLDEEVGHRRRYDLRGMRTMLHRSGFVSIHVRYWNSILFPLMLIYRRLLNPGFEGELKAARGFNPILYRVLKSEEHVHLPFGASVVAIAQKPRLGDRHR